MCKEDQAEVLRLEGNEHFRAKRFSNAINCYTKSLQIHLNAAVLSNRAQAYLCLKRYEKALMDSKRAIALDGASLKASGIELKLHNFRHAMALQSLGLYELASKDLDEILKMDSSNKETMKLKESIKNKKNVRSVTLRCVDKCDTIRSEVPLKELHSDSVKVVGASCETHRVTVALFRFILSRKLQKEIASESRSVDDYCVRIPSPPTTSYQFIVDYTSLKESPEKFAEYFISIDPNEYDRLFGDIIESDMVSLLIAGFNKVVNDCNHSKIIESLLRLRSVPRFDIAAMFLDETDKKGECLRLIRCFVIDEYE
ncbi:unnamed protein product [Anisakis simplex]|uniref:RNA polymerase II-associated protein 3 n=1 Tax=Anisakis simplex TaxID=6269 RepID=A0A0M3K2G4_ANISI|nr:unnamed protein product [Anisakis simplex]